MIHKPTKLIAALAVACSLSLSVAAKASVVVDTFDDVDASVTWPLRLDTVGSAPDVLETGLSSALGGQRLTRLTAEALDVERLDEVQVGVFAPPGILAYASSILADGKLEVVYDGGASGLNADLSGDSMLSIDLLAFDFANQLPMNVSVTLSDGTVTAELTQPVTGPGRQDVVFPFAKFSNFSSLDLTDIDSISITFDPGDGADFRVGEISSVVPEPATLGLLMVGAFLGVSRRRK